MTKSTTDIARSLDTVSLWDATHAALMNGEWSRGRAYLEELAQRSDVVDHLCRLETYQHAARLEGKNDLSRPSMAQYRSLLSDRLLAVEWRCEQNTAA